jgi:kynurenine 3-monooxygenase
MSRSAVTIIGAGLCGSLLAIILARRGVKSTVLERRSDPRTTAVPAGRSINLALSSRGIRALKYAGVFDQVRPLLIPMKGRLIHEDGQADSLQPYGQRKNEKIYSVSRAALNRILVGDAISKHGVRIRFEHEVVACYPQEAVLRVRNHAKAADYDIKSTPIIAADGAGSNIRRAYGSSAAISATESLLEHGYKELTIPAGPDGQFRLASNVLHIWPRGEFMLIALPNPGGDFTLTLFMPNTGPDSFAAINSEQKTAAFFAKHFSSVVPLIDNLQSTFQSNPAGILGTVRCQHWHDGGRMLLIGDAAHAVVPFHGQGMNLAFEDCVVLDQVLANPEADWQTVFEVFEREQIANANAIADMALDNYVEMRDTVRDPKYLLRKELSFELERRLPQRFIPRYSMVMFHDEIPYAVAKERGAMQEKLLDNLTADANTMADIDISQAVAAVEKRMPPLH